MYLNSMCKKPFINKYLNDLTISSSVSNISSRSDREMFRIEAAKVWALWVEILQAFLLLCIFLNSLICRLITWTSICNSLTKACNILERMWAHMEVINEDKALITEKCEHTNTFFFIRITHFIYFGR